MRVTVLAILVALTLAGAAAGAAQGAGLPGLETEAPGFAVRPSSIGYTGDGTGYIGRLPIGARPGQLRWKTWNAHRAYGVGTIWINDCVPDCATHIFHPHNGSVRASRVSGGHFTQITIRYQYHGKPVTDVRRLQHGLGVWFWR